MKRISLHDISFDEEDLEIFTIESDLLLKAKAIQYSIIPKLNVLIEHSVSLIREIYGIEVFSDNSIIHSWPNFRENRQNNLKIDYSSAFIGIGGTRRDIWKGLKRIDNKPVKIIPFVCGYELSKSGLDLLFISKRYSIKLDINSYRKYYSFIKNKMPVIHTVLSCAEIIPDIYADVNVFTPFEKIIDLIISSTDYEDYKLDFHKIIKCPIEPNDLHLLAIAYAMIYPLYDSFIRISLDEPDRFDELLVKLDEYLDKTLSFEYKEKKLRESIDDSILANVVDNTKVRAGLRWQVFERDNFKCVACGLSAENGAILHVDHIVPRSKGGKDEMNNYQTLCHLCNIGKSNKSNRNLRNSNNNV